MSGSTFPGRLGANSNPFGSHAASDAGPGSIHRVTEEDENEDFVALPTGKGFGFGNFGNFGNDGASPAGPPSAFRGAPNAEGFPSNYGMGRRTSVSAESLNPTATSNDNWTPPSYPKTPEQRVILKQAIGSHSIFSHLDDEQASLMLGAMTAKDIPAKDIKVCTLHDYPLSSSLLPKFQVGVVLFVAHSFPNARKTNVKSRLSPKATKEISSILSRKVPLTFTCTPPVLCSLVRMV
jgi:cAMP-dependent protein kinase regulator